MTKLYWQVYLNLERELLGLADAIYINDDQQDVYSMRIADLLIRTVVEIEALAKELYLASGGAEVPDEEMYFDTVCIAHLDGLWDLDKKIVQVVSPNIYFEKEENKVLHPLHKASKRGTSSADWNKAYQAVKHNRVKELPKGNLKNLIHGLAALYVLNLYYRDEKLSNLSNTDKAKVDGSFGSALFSVKIHRVHGLKSSGEYTKAEDYDECVYIEDYEPSSKKIAMEALAAINELDGRFRREKLEQMLRERIASGEEITEEWKNQAVSKVRDMIAPMTDHNQNKKIVNSLGQLRFDVVLNKRQY